MTGPGAKPRPTISGNSAKISWYSTDTSESSVEGEVEGNSGSCAAPCDVVMKLLALTMAKLKTKMKMKRRGKDGKEKKREG